MAYNTYKTLLTIKKSIKPLLYPLKLISLITSLFQNSFIRWKQSKNVWMIIQAKIIIKNNIITNIFVFKKTINLMSKNRTSFFMA